MDTHFTGDAWLSNHDMHKSMSYAGTELRVQITK